MRWILAPSNRRYCIDLYGTDNTYFFDKSFCNFKLMDTLLPKENDKKHAKIWAKHIALMLILACYYVNH